MKVSTESQAPVGRKVAEEETRSTPLRSEEMVKAKGPRRGWERRRELEDLEELEDVTGPVPEWRGSRDRAREIRSPAALTLTVFLILFPLFMSSTVSFSMC